MGRPCTRRAAAYNWLRLRAIRLSFTRKSSCISNTQPHINAVARCQDDQPSRRVPVPVPPKPDRPKRIVVGITGATGAPYAIRILTLLRQQGVETHLVISKWALATLKYETPMSEAELRGLASTSYTAKDMSAPIASGSFQHDGMMILPCSMKTLAAVRSGYGDDLIARAADVTLKEDRKLLLAVRETPLSLVHLDNMLFLRRANAIIFPPVPAFYTRPKTVSDIVEQSAGRMLDLMGIVTDGFERWNGFQKT
ncbi:hypothetical protein MY1884_004811 [Beauveria asiatica]